MVLKGVVSVGVAMVELERSFVGWLVARCGL